MRREREAAAGDSPVPRCRFPLVSRAISALIFGPPLAILEHDRPSERGAHHFVHLGLLLVRQDGPDFSAGFLAQLRKLLVSPFAVLGGKEFPQSFAGLLLHLLELLDLV